MYDNPCGSNPCGGLGATTVVESEPAWWEQPLETITGAVATRIGGSTSPYSPGTYGYGDTGYTAAPLPGVEAVAVAEPGMSTGNMLLLTGLGIAGLRMAGVL